MEGRGEVEEVLVEVEVEVVAHTHTLVAAPAQAPEMPWFSVAYSVKAAH